MLETGGSVKSAFEEVGWAVIGTTPRNDIRHLSAAERFSCTSSGSEQLRMQWFARRATKMKSCAFVWQQLFLLILCRDIDAGLLLAVRHHSCAKTNKVWGVKVLGLVRAGDKSDWVSFPGYKNAQQAQDAGG